MISLEGLGTFTNLALKLNIATNRIVEDIDTSAAHHKKLLSLQCHGMIAVTHTDAGVATMADFVWQWLANSIKGNSLSDGLSLMEGL